jgi:hypothetical protein
MFCFCKKSSWLAWFVADYWYRQKKYCESFIERVVLKHFVGWLWLERAFFRNPEASDYLSPAKKIGLHSRHPINLE